MGLHLRDHLAAVLDAGMRVQYWALTSYKTGKGKFRIFSDFVEDISHVPDPNEFFLDTAEQAADYLLGGRTG